MTKSPSVTDEEKWQWVVDLTDPEDPPVSSMETDEFDDADRDEEQRRFLNSGKDFMREEERVGKVLGCILAIVFWVIITSCYVAATWKDGSGQYWKSPSGEYIPYSGKGMEESR